MIDRRKAELIAYAVGAFVIVLLALRMLHHDSGGGARVALAQPPPGAGGAATAAEQDASATHAAHALVVDVAGEVRRPGVYRVPPGARVDEAIREAGGVTRQGESTAVNLAMPLHDGQQVVVPRRGAAGAVAPATTAGGAAAPGTPAAPGATPAQPISLSTATVAQLDGLDGIGPTLATRIVQYRDAHGGFRSIDELRQVDGIGDKRFASLRKAVQP